MRQSLRDCPSHGVSLASPLPRGGAPGAGPASGSSRRTRPSFSRAGRGSGSWTAKPRRAAAIPQASRASRSDPAPPIVRRDPQPHLARSQREEREGGAGAAPAMPWSPTPDRAALDIPHESINGAAGERVAAPCTSLQTVNSRHSRQIKGFLRGFRGIATKYLDSYEQVVRSHRTRRPAHARERVSRRHGQTMRFAN